MTTHMKKIFLVLTMAGGLMMSSCSDWLEVLPKNEQVTSDYWKSKEDVEAVLASGYYYMRTTIPYLIDWGELRGGSVYTPFVGARSKIQDFQLVANSSYCKWEAFYQVINMANSVINYAPTVLGEDETYKEASMKSHQTEAYFMRALTYFYLVRNFKEVPLVLTPYVDDSAPYVVAKSNENEILEQIKKDIETALDTDAAKESYDEVWANKGRATKWSLYALMADVCLWMEDYDGCITYANKLIEANASFRPVFISSPENWFTVFYPGNSNESIFELNWDYATYGQTSNSPSNYYQLQASSIYLYTTAMKERLVEETEEVLEGKNPVRSLYGAYVPSTDDYKTAELAYVWKYQGVGVDDVNAVRANKDANFIIYRMADVLLMKAEALIWKGADSWEAALKIINQIRVRANLPELAINLQEADELTMLKYVLNERDMELAAEGKRWYDLMRLGKSKNYKYKNEFIQMVIANNKTASQSWLRSVLKNEYAWYLPIFQDELEANELLKQNPYYDVTNQ